MKSVVVCMVLVALVASCAGASGFFPMGVWYEGGVGAFRHNLIPEDPSLAAKEYQRDFSDMVAHGVNAVVVPNTQPDHHQPLLDAAAANGLKLIVELDRVGGELGQMVRGSLPLSDDTLQKTLDTKLKPVINHPALWGIQLIDEPQPDSFERYARIATVLESYAPRLLPFSCLISSGPVESFVKTVRPRVVAFDHYPIGVGNAIGDKGPMQAFDRAANAACKSAAKYSVPVWAVLQTHTFPNVHRHPIPAEIRCMTYLSLANGCKGVWWFLYQTEVIDDPAYKGFMYGLVDQNFKGDARWAEIAKLTNEIRKLSPTLLKLNIAGNVMVESDGVAHVLKDKRGRLYVFAVNTDTRLPSRVTVRLDASAVRSRNPMIVKHSVDGFGFGSIMPNLFGNQVVWSDSLAAGDGALYEITE
ncbi:MAG: hypothetical protein M1133_16030 [Armatimonadetes bacterium]|nr:hypothetical protein [Armatimonadota bacterium]